MSFKDNFVGKHEEATLKVNTWLANLMKGRRQLQLLTKEGNAVQTEIENKLSELSTVSTVEVAQSKLSMEQFSKPLSFMLRTCLMGRVREVKPGQHARMFSLALLIKQFPNEILFQSSTDESESNSSNSSVFHLETEAHRCILDARILSACFKKVLLRLKGPTSKFVEASSNLSFAIRAFSKSFEEWRRADARRMAANLEETFMQTYSVYIGAMSSPDNTAGGDSGPSRSELVVATQHQLEKIRKICNESER